MQTIFLILVGLIGISSSARRKAKVGRLTLVNAAESTTGSTSTEGTFRVQGTHGQADHVQGDSLTGSKPTGGIRHGGGAHSGAASEYPFVIKVGPEHLYEGKFKIHAFSDIHARVKNTPEFSNFEDFKSSRLATEVLAGSATVLAYVGDMALLESGLPPPCAQCTPVVEKEIEAFVNWLGSLSAEKYPVKIVIPGNHDSCLDPLKADAEVVARLVGLFHKNGIHYLGGGTNLIDAVSVVVDSGSEQRHLNIVGMGISEARTLGCMGAFQHPGYKIPDITSLSGIFLKREEECGDECSKAHYEKAYKRVTSDLERVSNQVRQVDVLFMHGPPDNAGAKFQNAPGGPLLGLVQKMNPSLFVVGHIHGGSRKADFGKAYRVGDIDIINVAAKDEGPDARENDPRFDVGLPVWLLQGGGQSL